MRVLALEPVRVCTRTTSAGARARPTVGGPAFCRPRAQNAALQTLRSPSQVRVLVSGGALLVEVIYSYLGMGNLWSMPCAKPTALIQTSDTYALVGARDQHLS